MSQRLAQGCPRRSLDALTAREREGSMRHRIMSELKLRPPEKIGGECRGIAASHGCGWPS